MFSLLQDIVFSSLSRNAESTENKRLAKVTQCLEF